MVLGLEFSSPQRSVALVERVRNGPSRVVAESAEEDYRKKTALAQIDELLRLAGVKPAEVECIAIGLGPGSYTGIRSALAIAQGWQLARGVKVCGASSAEAVAWVARESGVQGQIQVLIDAQRNEVYVEDFELGIELRVVDGLRIEPVESWKQKQAPVVVGPEVGRWEAKGRVVFPTGKAVVELATDKGEFVPAESLEPIYLRAVNFVKAPPPRVLPPE